jgi:hypothetical protein
MSQWGRCRSCQDEIRWALSSVTGRAIPIDREPRSELEFEPSAFVLVANAAEDEPPYAVSLSRLRDANINTAGMRRFVSHFATCPKAAEHRKTPDA